MFTSEFEKTAKMRMRIIRMADIAEMARDAGFNFGSKAKKEKKSKKRKK